MFPSSAKDKQDKQKQKQLKICKLLSKCELISRIFLLHFLQNYDIRIRVPLPHIFIDFFLNVRTQHPLQAFAAALAA